MKKIVSASKMPFEFSSKQLKSIQALASLFRGIEADQLKIFTTHVSGDSEFRGGFEKLWAYVTAFSAQVVATQMLAFSRVMNEARDRGQTPWAVKNAADGLACTVVESIFNELARQIPGFQARVIASEGLKDGAPGIRVGAVYTKNGKSVDLPEFVISVDPIDGTSPFVAGRGGATSGFSVQLSFPGQVRVQLPDPLSVFGIVTGPHVPNLSEMGLPNLDPRPSKMAENVRNIALATLRRDTPGVEFAKNDIDAKLTKSRFAMMNRPYQNRQIVAELNRAGCQLTAAFDKDGKPDPKAVYLDGPFVGQTIWLNDKSNWETRDGRLVMVDDGNWTLHLNPDYLAVLGNGGLPEYAAMVASASNYTAVLLDKDNRQIELVEATATFALLPKSRQDPEDLKACFGAKSIQAFREANPGMTEAESLANLGKIWDVAEMGSQEGLFVATALSTLAREKAGEVYPQVHPELRGARLEDGVIKTSAIVASPQTVKVLSAEVPITLPVMLRQFATMEIGIEKLDLAKQILEIAYKYGCFEQAREVVDVVISQLRNAKLDLFQSLDAEETQDPERQELGSHYVSLMQSYNLSRRFIAILRDAAAVKKEDVATMKALIARCDSFLGQYHVAKHEIGGQVSEIRMALQDQVAVLSK